MMQYSCIPCLNSNKDTQSQYAWSRLVMTEKQLQPAGPGQIKMPRLTILRMPIKRENSGVVVGVIMSRAVELAFMRADKGKGLLPWVVTVPLAPTGAGDAVKVGLCFWGTEWPHGEPDLAALCLITYTQHSDVTVTGSIGLKRRVQ